MNLEFSNKNISKDISILKRILIEKKIRKLDTNRQIKKKKMQMKLIIIYRCTCITKLYIYMKIIHKKVKYVFVCRR